MATRVHMIAAAALLSGAFAAPACANGYMSIDGVPGNSKDVAHAGWIEIEDYSFGTAQTAAASRSMGSEAGRAQVHDITITKYIDKASPKLHEAVSTGKHFKKVTIEMLRSGGASGVRVILEDVMVAGVKIAGDGSTRTEAITLSFAREEATYPQDARRPMTAMPMMRPAAVQPH